MPGTNFSLIDLRALTEPACKLIDAVRSAAGILYEPTRIRRKANAEAEASVILARNQAEIQDIEIRASERLRNKEIRRQQNIETVTRSALAALPDSVSKDPVDQDWVHAFYENCQDVAQGEMQQLWGKILAGEVAKPGSFSLRCMRLIKDFQKRDAEIYTHFCTFIWTDQDGEPMALIYNPQARSITDTGFYYLNFLHLETLGLIQFAPTAGFNIRNQGGKTRNCAYFGRNHLIQIPQKVANLELGCAFLTSVGKELVAIAGAIPCEEFRLAVVANWRRLGCVVEELPG